MTANDPDTDTNGLVTYSLEPLAGQNQAAVTDMFAIDGESGWISTVREADCEVTRVYRFNVVATDRGSQVRLSSSVLVEVTVTDENDNPPRFLEDSYSGSVLESVAPGELVLTMTTADADVSLENRLVTCYITGERPLWSECVNSGNVGLLRVEIKACMSVSQYGDAAILPLWPMEILQPKQAQEVFSSIRLQSKNKGLLTE